MGNLDKCWICGDLGSASVVGSVLCLACRARYDEYCCVKCGQNVCIDKAIPHGDVCSGCLLRERASRLPPFLLEPIAAEAEAGRMILAIKLARETLGWSLPDAAYLANQIRERFMDDFNSLEGRLKDD